MKCAQQRGQHLFKLDELITGHIHESEVQDSGMHYNFEGGAGESHRVAKTHRMP